MKATNTWCALGLGSNLGIRAAYLQAAINALSQVPGLANLEQAPTYETAPLDCPDGAPPFLNTVVQARYTGDVFDLLTHTQAIEDQLGRERSGTRNEARVVDIDLLIVEGISLNSSPLTLPHPRMEERLFVLQPLADLRPELILPSGISIQERLEQLR
ncbi:MAG: 2-amino-4-hydroxy-6-hydroxymethyldihydropteridine diphosphokinase [Verrucomicrobiales bacterium]|jgi:2-amino-4-hydroxy-6-hydroxymethyldihydropteridine diphosphokinase